MADSYRGRASFPTIQIICRCKQQFYRSTTCQRHDGLMLLKRHSIFCPPYILSSSRKRRIPHADRFHVFIIWPVPSYFLPFHDDCKSRDITSPVILNRSIVNETYICVSSPRTIDQFVVPRKTRLAVAAAIQY